MKLTAQNVESTFLDCLFGDGEPQDGAVMIEGVAATFGLHEARLKSHKAEVVAMMAELPDGFKEGWSFLNLCMTKDGTQWGEHRNCEQLMVLAVGLGLMEYSIEREMWPVLPGGVPYVQAKAPKSCCRRS